MWGPPLLSVLGLGLALGEGSRGTEGPLVEREGTSMLASLFLTSATGSTQAQRLCWDSQSTLSWWPFSVHESIVRHWLLGWFPCCLLVSCASSGINRMLRPGEVLEQEESPRQAQSAYRRWEDSSPLVMSPSYHIVLEWWTPCWDAIHGPCWGLYRIFPRGPASYISSHLQETSHLPSDSQLYRAWDF